MKKKQQHKILTAEVSCTGLGSLELSLYLTNPGRPELPSTGTNFFGPKLIRATEVLLAKKKMIHVLSFISMRF